MGFAVVVVLLALVRCVFPSVAGTAYTDNLQASADLSVADSARSDTLRATGRFFNGKHPILSVSSFKNEFPESTKIKDVDEMLRKSEEILKDLPEDDEYALDE